MKAAELAKTFDHHDFEDRVYEAWRASGGFRPDEDGSRDPFVIVIPPPNVTGVLHMGHGLNNSLQDILIRYYRMKGRPTLWVPGTDHAGIATQNVVERKLREEGTTREELGRDEFVERTWKMKEEHHSVITKQLEKIGASCDWSRERFTLDDGLSRAVREVFVALYERNLVYRGEYLVNWCTSCGTALSDDEVEHREVNGQIWRVRYPLVDGPGSIEVATTRPETMLGDTGVAVHPADERYAHLVGARVRLPLTDREIPIVEDSFVDREFGTGAVKITPAHDPNDWAMGERHDLARINVLTAAGLINENAPEKYRGMTVKEARKAVVADLESRGFLVEVKDHVHQIGHCYRCDTVIEPWQSTQWFVRMQPLAEKALKAWEDGEIVFYPRRWENTYTHWLRNIRDWCISRQLWWGHRIPVWYDDESGDVIVSRTDPTEDPAYAGRSLRQDPDVLDTWFSSWIWPFSTLGWPEQTPDLDRFYPTTALVTGYDIIFFWVARMVMAGIEFMGAAPFRDIYITGLVRDIHGRKMSKSLGNGIDPLDIVDSYGADAHKFTLAYLSAQGQDVPIETESFQLGSKFANKIWNATRYLLMNLGGRTPVPFAEVTLDNVDRWIYHRLNDTIARMDAAMAEYRFNEAAHGVYEFFWNDFCDWYIEASKLSLYAEDDREKDRKMSLLLYVLEETMRLLHPLMSFISEEIYGQLPDTLQPADGTRRSPVLMTAAFPRVHGERSNESVAASFASLQELVRGVRTVRSEFAIPPVRKIDASVRFEADFASAQFIRSASNLITMLAGIGALEFVEDEDRRAGSITAVGTGFEVYLDVRALIDVDTEVSRIERAIEKEERLLLQSTRKLSSEGFVAKAKPEVVARERERVRETENRLERLRRVLDDLTRS